MMTAVRPFKMGLKPREPGKFLPHYSMLRSAMHVRNALKPAPASFSSATALSGPLGMFKNDTYGDCADAAVCHELQVESANASKPELQLTDDTALTLYSENTGFDISKNVVGPDGSISNPTDQGTNLVDLMRFRMSKGVLLPDSTRDKIVGAFELDSSNQKDIMQATYECGGVQLGIYCYDAFMSVAPGGEWVIPLFAQPAGGHAIYLVAYDANGVTIESWGSFYTMSWKTFMRVTMESYAVITKRYTVADGDTPLGLPIPTVEQIMTASGNTLVPATDPPPAPAPSPAPEPAPAPAVGFDIDLSKAA